MELNSLKSFSLLENVLFLKKTALFSNIKTSELKAIASVVEEMSFHYGEAIVKENDPGDSAYIIKEGRIKIVKKAPDNCPVDLAELSEGDFFGEMSLFDDEARSASAFAVTPCVVLKLMRDDLIDVIGEHPSIAVELIKIFVKRLRAADARIERGGESTVVHP
jgi:CRP/FNR family transcriptional regulator, cyclic AMP receptor protein